MLHGYFTTEKGADRTETVRTGGGGGQDRGMPGQILDRAGI